jgi:hypothetical protein
MLPSAAERGTAKTKIQIVGQHTDGKEHGIGFECPAGHLSIPKPIFKSLILNNYVHDVASMGIRGGQTANLTGNWTLLSNGSVRFDLDG